MTTYLSLNKKISKLFRKVRQIFDILFEKVKLHIVYMYMLSLLRNTRSLNPLNPMVLKKDEK